MATMAKTGVQKIGDAWGFNCPDCEVVGEGLSSRDKARAAYALHRTEVCTGYGVAEQDRPAKKAAAKTTTASKPKAEKKASKPKASSNGTLYRVATVTNPKTERDVTVPVKKDGTQVPRFNHLTAAKKWREVRAGSWSEATTKAAAGEGKLIKA